MTTYFPSSPRIVFFNRHSSCWLLSLIFLLIAGPAAAEDKIYQKPSSFITSAFSGKLPPTSVLKLDSATKSRVKKILGHSYKSSRIRYWNQGARTVYILEEIGKTKPITTGFIVENGILKKMNVLIYRESHGWEVSKKFFSRQLAGARLNSATRLSKTPRNIAGATLSVRALTKLSRLALYLDTVR